MFLENSERGSAGIVPLPLECRLCLQVVIAGKAYNDPSVSPVVRQTLLHWAYELTKADFEAVEGRISKGSGATYVPRHQIDQALESKRKREAK